MNNGTAWVDSRTPWTKLGFHVNCEENNSVDFRYVFLTNETLPAVEPIPEDVDFNITNPEYSYTGRTAHHAHFWSSNVMYNECLTMEENNGRQYCRQAAVRTYQDYFGSRRQAAE